MVELLAQFEEKFLLYNKKIFYAFFTLLFLGGAFAASAQSEPLIPVELVMGGRKYTQKELNLFAADAMFTSDTLNINSNAYSNLSVLNSPPLSPQNLKKYYPWLYPHIYPEKSAPRLLAVNKWVKPVKIAFGMPNDLKPLNVGDINLVDVVYDLGAGSGRLKEMTESSYLSDLGAEIIKLSGELSAVTGIDIRYTPQNEDVVSDYANIRVNIIPFLRPDTDKKFKLESSQGQALAYAGPDIVQFKGESGEGFIKNGFVFTAHADAQVDGYFLSNEKNEIQMAVCYIWKDHSLSLIKKLLQECLIRAMGMPGLVDERDYYKLKGSYLNSWNKDGVLTEGGTESSLGELDRYLLGLLYNSELKPGDDYISAQKLFLGNKN